MRIEGTLNILNRVYLYKTCIREKICVYPKQRGREINALK